MPFIYTAFYVFALIAYLFAGERTLDFLDSMLYISPAVCVQFLILSHILRLCRWHHAACILPVTPQAFTFLDATVVDFSDTVATIAVCASIFMATTLLVAAYEVFLKPKHNGRKEKPAGNP